MNPLVHMELSWLAAQGLRRRRERLLVAGAGLAPDLDGLSALAGADAYAKFHHLLTHGVLAASFFALIASAAAGKGERLKAAGAALLAFHLHLLCDLVGSGREWPIAYLWPLNDAFWGLSWAWELDAWPNLAIGLLATLVCLGAAQPLGRTVVEIVSTRADAAVVGAVRARLGKAGLRPSR